MSSIRRKKHAIMLFTKGLGKAEAWIHEAALCGIVPAGRAGKIRKERDS